MHPRKIHLLRICNFLTQKNILCWEKGWGEAVLEQWSIFQAYVISKYCRKIIGVAVLCCYMFGDYWEVCKLIYSYLVGWNIKGRIFSIMIHLFKGSTEKILPLNHLVHNQYWGNLHWSGNLRGGNTLLSLGSVSSFIPACPDSSTQWVTSFLPCRSLHKPLLMWQRITATCFMHEPQLPFV